MKNKGLNSIDSTNLTDPIILGQGTTSVGYSRWVDSGICSTNQYGCGFGGYLFSVSNDKIIEIFKTRFLEIGFKVILHNPSKNNNYYFTEPPEILGWTGYGILEINHSITELIWPYNSLSCAGLVGKDNCIYLEADDDVFLGKFWLKIVLGNNYVFVKDIPEFYLIDDEVKEMFSKINGTIDIIKEDLNKESSISVVGQQQIDGSSVTPYNYNNQIYVCSSNNSLTTTLTGNKNSGSDSIASTNI